jgi:hypothetical protein
MGGSQSNGGRKGTYKDPVTGVVSVGGDGLSLSGGDGGGVGINTGGGGNLLRIVA